MFQGFLENGVSHGEAVAQAQAQIMPAVLDWETTNREIVHARRTINLRKRKVKERHAEELRKRIDIKSRKNESILEEARELFELDHPTLHPEKRKSDDPWGDLALAVGNKESNYADDVRWVYNNAETPVEGIPPSEVPSRGALTLLKTIQNQPAMYAAFMKDHWSRLIPSKGAIEAEARFRSGNAKLLEMFRVFEDDLKSRRGDILLHSKDVDVRGQPLTEEDPDEDLPEESEA